jgi:hypothetical protein
MSRNLNRRRFGPVPAIVALGAISAITAGGVAAAAAQVPPTGHAAAHGLGQLSGYLPRSKFTLGSLINIDLSTETARLPLYPGTAPNPKTGGTEKVWYILLDASDQGLADDLGVNYAPKLANIAIGCAACVQTVTEANPSAVYDAPIVATGNGPFDVTTHTDTSDRALGIHIAGPSKQGQFAESWVDMVFSKGFDSGEPIVYLSTDAGQPLTAVLERATYVPALNNESFNGGDDFLGSARERLFGFINGQTGLDNPQAQGFQHLALDSEISQNASAANTTFINGLRYGADLLNVFGDFPTLSSPRHSDAYSPLWDAQLGLWTPKAIKAGLDKRQVDENTVLNLAATRPDLLTGVNPATGAPAPYGSVGIDIVCAVLGYTASAPTAALQPPAPGSQFPPR